MPLIATGLVFAGLASLGLPGLAGFIAEVSVFLGTFERFEWAVLTAFAGVVLSAGYILWTLQRVVFGPVRHEWDDLKDMSHWWEGAAALSLAALVVLLGVYPDVVTDVMNPALEAVAARVSA